MTDDLNIVKGGESIVRISLIRSVRGLRVEVKAHPVIEEFFKQNAVHPGQPEPTTQQVNSLGRYWQPSGKEGVTLSAYDRVTALPITLGTDDMANLDRVGQPLLEPYAHPTGRRSHNVNLSFLRLVGISEPEGVVFYVRGVHSIELVRETKEKLSDGVRRFYASYLKPVEMHIVMQTQEVALAGLVEIKR